MPRVTWYRGRSLYGHPPYTDAAYYGEFSCNWSRSTHLPFKLTRLIRTSRNTDTFYGLNGVRNNGGWLYHITGNNVPSIGSWARVHIGSVYVTGNLRTLPIRKKHCVNSKVYYTTTRINGEHMEQTTYRRACAALTTAGYNVNNEVAWLPSISLSSTKAQK